MEKRIKWLIACLLLAETMILSFRFYQDLQKTQEIPVSVASSQFAPIETKALEIQDQAFSQTVLELVTKYYVHANQLPYGAWMQEALRLLQEGQGVSYSPTTSTLSFEGHSIALTTPMSLEEVLREVRTISEFLNQTRFYKEWTTAKDLSPGCTHLLEALMQALDPHSILMPQEHYADLKQATEGKFGGLGLLLHMENEVLSIGRVLPHSPAQRQGLTSRDRIIAIDKTSTYGKSLDEITTLMRGDAGSSVRLSVLKTTDWGPREVLLRRELIQVPSVERQERITPQGHFLQLKILSFSQHTTLDVIAALHQAEKKKKLDGLILDLRENPGGLLDEAVHLASLFLPKGIVVSMRGQTEEFQSVLPVKEKWTLPIVTLMDENSASASEILAGALKDHHRSVVVGTRSYGKASVQTIFELPYAYALKLTIARYFTPNGTSIQDKGIVPHIWLQPVADKEENRDLLGEDRYRQEKFLVNGAPVEGAEQSPPQLMGYYLKRPRKEDQPLQLALALLAKRHPFSTLNHSREIQATLANWSKEVANYLADRHHVQWQGASVLQSRGENLKPLTLSLSLMNPILHPRQPTSAVYEIRNRGTVPLHGLSLLFTEPESLGSSAETLIGTLPPSGVFRGTLALLPPAESRSTPMPLSVRVAQSGTLEPVPLQTLSLEVHPYPTTSLKTLAVFKTENPLSSLEANGSGTLHIRVTNTGKSPIHHLVAKISNLGGKQIEINTPKKQLEVLTPGTTKELNFSIQGGQQIATSSIQIGVQIDGDELPQSVRQSVSLGAIPACQLSARRKP